MSSSSVVVMLRFLSFSGNPDSSSSLSITANQLWLIWLLSPSFARPLAVPKRLFKKVPPNLCLVSIGSISRYEIWLWASCEQKIVGTSKGSLDQKKFLLAIHHKPPYVLSPKIVVSIAACLRKIKARACFRPAMEYDCQAHNIDSALELMFHIYPLESTDHISPSSINGWGFLCDLGFGSFKSQTLLMLTGYLLEWKICWQLSYSIDGYTFFPLSTCDP